MTAHTRDLEDRPSKMPTRLADGLGPGSDLDDGLHRHSPHPRISPGNWFPRVDSQEGEPT
jgi:hypothetical protein